MAKWYAHSDCTCCDQFSCDIHMKDYAKENDEDFATRYGFRPLTSSTPGYLLYRNGTFSHIGPDTIGYNNEDFEEVRPTNFQMSIDENTC